MTGDAPSVNDAPRWDDRYRRGDARWDLGSATPAFADLLRSDPFPPGDTLILGSGTGHDAILFRRAGHRVTAVDFSSAAAARTTQLAGESGQSIRVLEQDLFTLTPGHDGSFDYVVEYVTYCAIDPSRRAAFARVVENILRPGGLFIALLFPLDERPGGPPFTVSLAELETLLSPAMILRSLYPPSTSVSPRKGKELMTIWQKNILREG